MALLEDDVSEWMKDPGAMDFGEFEKKKLKALEEALSERRAKLPGAAQKAREALAACPNGENALKYFESDLETSASCKEILKGQPV